MRIGAMILGIIGGIFGLFIAGIAIIVQAASVDHNMAGGFLLLMLSVGAIVGAALAQAKPLDYVCLAHGFDKLLGILCVQGFFLEFLVDVFVHVIAERNNFRLVFLDHFFFEDT